MATRRYRIHFVASFDQMIEAPDDVAARGLADLLQTTLALELTNHGSDTRCAWNTIDRLGDDAD
jgi:hypothetical protein